MGKLKIGFVLDDTLDTPDGVQQYILTLGAWLTSVGHEVRYLVGETSRTDIPGVHSVSRNVKVRFNGNRMSTPLPANKRAIRTLLMHEQFDILHVQIPYSPFMAARVIMAAPRGTAVVGTFHIAPHSRLVRVANRLLGLLLRRSLRRFDALLSVSQAAADFAEQTFHIDTAILPNVVKVSPFASAKPFTVRKGQVTIIYLGRLVPRKGCRVLLEAVHRLRTGNDPAVMPLVKVIVCGRGPLEAELKIYVQRHELADTVEFTGFVTEEDKARCLKTADIAVFPSIGGESFGIVLLEAMAAMHPAVLAADNSGYHTVMAPRPEQLFPVNDAAGLAELLQCYVQDSNRIKQAVDWQKIYIQGFDVPVVGRRLLARYEEALRLRRSVQ